MFEPMLIHLQIPFFDRYAVLSGIPSGLLSVTGRLSPLLPFASEASEEGEMLFQETVLCPLCLRKLLLPSLPLLPPPPTRPWPPVLRLFTQLTAKEDWYLFSYLSLTAVPLHLLLLTSQPHSPPSTRPLPMVSKPIITNFCGLKKILL